MSKKFRTRILPSIDLVALKRRFRWRLRMLKLGALMPPIAGAEDNPPKPKPDPEPPKPEPEPTGDDKTFTQEDVDKIVQDRLARDRKDRPSDDEIAEMRKKAEAHEAAEEEKRSDLEKAQKAQEKAETERDQATATAHKSLRRAAIISAAAAEGALDPSEIHALLADTDFKVTTGDQGEKEVTVTVGDDGQVTGAEEAVKALLESKQHLVGERPTPTPGDGGARPPANQGDLDEQIAEATKEGDWNLVSELNIKKLAKLRKD